MYQDKKILGLIGARGGSKGLPNKNILNLAGKPLIHWTIEAGQGSRYIDKIHVSTDCNDIKLVSEELGAIVPFLRPEELASDTAAIEDVIKYSIDYFKSNGMVFDYIVLLQPTSPLRNSSHIDEAIEHFFNSRKSESDTLVSIYEAPRKSSWLIKKTNEGYIDFVFGNKVKGNRRQELDQMYYPNGAIYIFPNQDKIEIYNETTQFYIMDPTISIDIDYKEDLDKAEEVFRNINE